MTKTDIINAINTGNAKLVGTVRVDTPAIQMDRWRIDDNDYLVETYTFWNPNVIYLEGTPFFKIEDIRNINLLTPIV